MKYETLDVRKEGDLLRVVLNRPDHLNAMNRKLVEELRGLFIDLYWRRDVRIVAITGAGRAFCAGLDLKEADSESDKGGLAESQSVGESLDRQRSIAEIVIAMRRCPQPIVAMLNGAASGGGFALALASDIRIATPQTRMNAAFIRIGLSACDIGVSYFLPRMVGSSVAAEYMLTGRFIDAQKALMLGLVSRVVDRDALEEEANDLINDLRHASPLGLRLTKEALNHAIDAQGLEAAIAMEDRNQILASRDGAFKEGVRAFIEKRRPNYT